VQQLIDAPTGRDGRRDHKTRNRQRRNGVDL